MADADTPKDELTPDVVGRNIGTMVDLEREAVSERPVRVDIVERLARFTGSSAFVLVHLACS